MVTAYVLIYRQVQRQKKLQGELKSQTPCADKKCVLLVSPEVTSQTKDSTATALSVGGEDQDKSEAGKDKTGLKEERNDTKDDDQITDKCNEYSKELKDVRFSGNTATQSLDPCASEKDGKNMNSLCVENCKSGRSTPSFVCYVDDEGNPLSESVFEKEEEPHSVINLRKASVFKISKTTKMMFVISLVYLVTYIPVLFLNLYRAIKPNLLTDMPSEIRWIYFLFFNFLFLGSAANPVIYSFCNAKFRARCLKIIRQIGRRFSKDARKSSQSSNSSGLN